MSELILQPDKMGKLNHLRQLDGLRGIAILLVLTCHTWGNLKTPLLSLCGLNLTSIANMGKSGVQLFFVLSGYLLNVSVKENLRRKNLVIYWKKRACRIIPAYYVAVFFALIFATGLNWVKTFLFSKAFWFHIFFLQTLDTNILNSINGVFWSLGPEIQFYIFLPVILIFLTVLESKRGFRARIGVLLVFAFFEVFLRLISNLSNLSGQTAEILSHNFPFFMSSFAAGMIISEIEPKFLGTKFFNNHRMKIRFIDLIVFMSYIAISYFVYLCEVQRRFDPLIGVANNLLISFSYGAILFCAVTTDSLFNKITGLRPLCLIGLVSYGLFLFHLPILESPWMQQTFRRTIEQKQFFGLLVAILLLTLLPATISYFVLEKPFIKYAAKRKVELINKRPIEFN